MPIRAILMLAPALVVGLLVWFFQESRLGAQLAEVRLESSQYRAEVLAEKAAAAERVRKVEGDWNAKYQSALNSARDRERVLRADLASRRRTGERMRAQQTEAASRIATATAASLAEYTLSLSTVFEDCRAAYAGMGEVAQRHADDARTLIEAWPVNQE